MRCVRASVADVADRRDEVADGRDRPVGPLGRDDVSVVVEHRRRDPARIRVTFGLPDPDLLTAAREGRVVLAGCTPDVPVEIECPVCGAMAVSSAVTPFDDGDEPGIQKGSKPPI
jgi:hypothetical protein